MGDSCPLADATLLDETDIIGVENEIYLITKDEYCGQEETKREGYGLLAADFFNVTETLNGYRELILLQPIDFKQLGGPRYRISLSTDRCYVFADVLVLPDSAAGPVIEISHQPTGASVVDGLKPPISYIRHSGVNLG